jgi:hypothetical protein
VTKIDQSIVTTAEESSVAHYENLHNPRRDDIDVMSEFYPAFGIMFTEEEVAQLVTVGDVNDLLFEKLYRIGHGEKCRYAMIFFRLRSFFRNKFDGLTIGLDTKVGTLPTNKVHSLLMDLGKETELVAPFTGLKYGCLLMTIILVGFAALLFGGLRGDYLIALVGSGCIFASAIALASHPGNWENPEMTIRDMIIKIEPLNYHLLTKDGGRHDRPTLWNALISVLADVSDLDAKRISRTTHLIRSE